MSKQVRINMTFALVLVFVGASLTSAFAASVSGTVYLDANASGVRDAGEAGVAGVAVSDGRAVAATGTDGAYQLVAPDGPVFIRITTPTNYALTTGFFARVDASQPVVGMDFGLRAEAQSVPFLVVQVTDIHITPPNARRLAAWVAEMNNLAQRPAFIVATGDLVGDANPATVEDGQKQYQTYVDEVAKLQARLFSMPGNHEHLGTRRPDFDRGNPLFGKGMYQEYLGPMYYSTDYAGVHFVMLDGTDLDAKGVDFTGFPADELAWLKADLALVPPQRRIVLFCHQPPQEARNAAALAELLAGRKVVGCFVGHIHTVWKMAWHGIPVQIGGALSGSWWGKYCPDGSPNGYRFVKVNQDGLETFYNATTREHQIEVERPGPGDTVSGRLVVEAKVYDPQDSLTAAYIQLDGRRAPATLDRRGLWKQISASAAIAGLSDGVYQLRVCASGPQGTFALVQRVGVARDPKARIRMTPPALPEPDGYSYYWGDVHAHTSYSDGKEKPENAFAMARDEAKLDFFALTDHLESLTDAEWADTLAQVEKFNAPGKFVVLPGVEWTKRWGHCNVINTSTRVFPSAFPEFHRQVEQMGAVSFFNHAAWHYAQNGVYDHDNQAYVPDADDVMIGSEVRSPAEREAFILALRNGWHLGTIGSSDTHSPNWGKTGKWTIALAPELTRDGILEALRAMRFFSTADRNCRPYFAADGHLLGAMYADKRRASFEIGLSDPDNDDRLGEVCLYQDGQPAYTFYLNVTAELLPTPLAPEPGQHFYFVEFRQQDGNLIYSSPIWREQVR